MPATTGVAGQRWRATVTEWGAVEPWDGSPALDWYVAADDRWHVPGADPSVRQRMIEGTPVTETRVRVPHGDVVQTIYSCADGGGVTVVEVANESTLPVAVAFDRRDVLTERPIPDVPIEGIELPAGSFVLPIGHSSRIRIGLAHTSSATGQLPSGLPAAAQVVHGWLATTEQASRLVVPGGAESVTAARCELLLSGPPDPDGDPAAYLLALREHTRLRSCRAHHPLVFGGGERDMNESIAFAAERLGGVPSWEADVALASALHALASLDEHRAVKDLERIISRRPASARPDASPGGIWSIPWLESSIADGPTLFPRGLPHAWLGQSLEAHRVPTGPTSSVSVAIRWHGARPAVLWEQSGPAVTLTAPVLAPGWRDAAPTGETLWPAPD